MAVVDQLRDKHQAHGTVKGGDDAQQQGQPVNLIERLTAREGHDAQHKRQKGRRGLRDQEEFAAVPMVCDIAGDRQKNQLRRELHGGGDADGRGVMLCEHGQHQPVLGDPLHPGANIGYEGAHRPKPVVVDLERPEHAALDGRRLRGVHAQRPITRHVGAASPRPNGGVVKTISFTWYAPKFALT